MNYDMVIKKAPFGARASLSRYIDDVMSESVFNQLRLTCQAKFHHEAGPVGIHRVWADV